MLFGHLVRMDESSDARRILTAVPQSEWRRPVGRPYTSWMATLTNDLARHNLTLEDAIELAVNKPLWRILAASGATHWWCIPNNDEWWWWKGWKAELTWVAGYIPRWFTRTQTVTHPSSNRARRRVTTLIETNTLLLCQATTICSWKCAFCCNT